MEDSSAEAVQGGSTATGKIYGPTAGGAPADWSAQPQVQARTDPAKASDIPQQHGQSGSTAREVAPSKKRKNDSPLQGRQAAGQPPAGHAPAAAAQPAEQGQAAGRAKKRRKAEAHAAAEVAAREGGAVLASAGAAGEASCAGAASTTTASLREDGGAREAAPEQAAASRRKGTKQAAGEREQTGGAGQADVAGAAGARQGDEAGGAGDGLKRKMSDTLARALARLVAERPGNASATAPQVAHGPATALVLFIICSPSARHRGSP